MKFKQKTIKSFLVLLIIISTLITTGVAIYYFGFQAIKNNNSNQDLKVQPTFSQTEINWMTRDKNLILPRFQQLLKLKRPQGKFSYAVDNRQAPTTIKVSYFLENQVINWFYELQYSES